MSLDHWARDADPKRLVQCTSSPSKNVFKASGRGDRPPGRQPAAGRGGADRAAGVERDRRHRPRRRPLRSCRWPAARDCASARRSCPSAVWPREARIPPTKPPDWSWRLLTVVDTTTKRVDLPDELQPAIVPPDTPADDVPRAPQGRLHRPPAARHRRHADAAADRVRTQLRHRSVRGHGRRPPESCTASTRRRSIVKFDAVEEDQPLPPGRPPDPTVTFGPHTVHRVALRTPS